MPARRCPACDRELVRRNGEKLWQFRTRKTCNRTCFAIQAQKINRSRVDMKGEIESVGVEKRKAEVLQQWRAGLENEGCRFTDDLR